MLSLLATGAQAQVRVSMSADRTSLALGEQLVVQITVQSEGGGSPDIELPGFAGFQVVSQQIQRPMQFSFSFGSRAVVRSSTNYTFGLQPVSAGRITIEPVRVKVDGQLFTSSALEISVAGGAGAPQAAQPGATNSASGAAADARGNDTVAFVRTAVDKPAPYVGEQVTVTIYLYVRQQLRSAPQVKQEASTEGFWTHDLLSPDRPLEQGRQEVDGQVYAVYVLRRFAAFALRSGDLAIGPMSLRIDLGTPFDMFAPTRATTLERTGVAVPLPVRPLPDEGKPDGDIAVGRFELTATLDRDQVATGDAVTLKASVRGVGNLGGVRLATPAIDGVEVLQPEIKDLVEAPRDLVTSTRHYAWLLVPKTAGVHALPPLVLHTFDPLSGRYQTLTSAPLTLVAAGQAVAAPSTPEPTVTDTAPAAPGVRAEHVEWPPIRARSALRRTQARLVDSTLYACALALPPFAWLCLLTVTSLRRRVASRAAQPQAIANREARRHLGNAEEAAQRGEAVAFHAEAAAALIGALRARVGAEVAGLTRPELRAELVRRGTGEELAGAIVTQLDRWDFARFGSAGTVQLAEETARLRELFRRIEALELAGQEAA